MRKDRQEDKKNEESKRVYMYEHTYTLRINVQYMLMLNFNHSLRLLDVFNDISF